MYHKKVVCALRHQKLEVTDGGLQQHHYSFTSPTTYLQFHLAVKSISHLYNFDSVSSD